jgi:hypothetical protein
MEWRKNIMSSGGTKNTINGLIGEYRQLRKNVARIDNKINSLNKRAKTLVDEQDSLYSEIREKKALINYCIETGETPIEAKLKRTVQEMEAYCINKNNIHRFDRYSGIVAGSNSPISGANAYSMISSSYGNNPYISSSAALSALAGASGALGAAPTSYNPPVGANGGTEVSKLSSITPIYANTVTNPGNLSV